MLDINCKKKIKKYLYIKNIFRIFVQVLKLKALL